MNESRQPKEYDLVLGGNNYPPTNGLVLGGIEGVKQRLESEDIEQQFIALSEALNYQEKGLDLVIDIWKERSGKLKWQAYRLLKQKNNTKVKQALQDYNPWLHLKCQITLQDSAKGIAISADNQKIISGGNFIKIWDLNTGELLETINPQIDIDYFIITPDARTIIYRSTEYDYASNIYIQDLQTQTSQNLSGYYCFFTSSLAISSSGRLFGCGNSIYELPSLGTKVSIQGHPTTYKTNCLAIDDRNNKIVSGGNDKTVIIWHLETGKRRKKLKGHRDGVNCVAISPDGQTVVSGSKDKTVKIRDLDNKKAKYTLKGHSRWIKDVKISPDGQTLFSTGRDKTIKIWDLETGELLNTLTGHSHWIYNLAISTDGSTLVSCSRDKTIKVWKVSL